MKVSEVLNMLEDVDDIRGQLSCTVNFNKVNGTLDCVVLWGLTIFESGRRLDIFDPSLDGLVSQYLNESDPLPEAVKALEELEYGSLSLGKTQG
jgi:hypothetical protein